LFAEIDDVFKENENTAAAGNGLKTLA